MPQIELHVGILLPVQQNGKDKGHDLADDRRHGGARDLHTRQAEVAEDQDGVENDVDDCAGALRNHGIRSAAGRLQETFKKKFSENAEGRDTDHADVIHAIGNGLRLRRQGAHVRLRAENAEQHAQQHAAGRQQQAVERGGVDLLGIALAQCAGEQRVDAHGHARGHADHDILHWERQRDSGQRVVVHVRDARDEHAVHDVVKRLHQHGKRHRQRHGQKELSHREHAHFVFFQCTTHVFLSLSQILSYIIMAMRRKASVPVQIRPAFSPISIIEIC